MKYKIGNDGRVSAGVRHVVLDQREDGTEIGVWVQPGAASAAYRLRDRWQELHGEAVDELAAELGIEASELDDDQREGVEPKLTEEFTTALSVHLRTCFVRWDEGLVEYEGKAVEPSEKITDGATASDAWIDFICEHDVPVALQIIQVASGVARRLEGNSEGPSAGTGGTDEEPRAAEAPESTVTVAASAEDPAPDLPAADTSEVPANPA